MKKLGLSFEGFLVVQAGVGEEDWFFCFRVDVGDPVLMWQEVLFFFFFFFFH